MKQVVFKQKKVAQFISNHFVALDLDIIKDTLPKKFTYIGIPTYFMINTQEKEVGMFMGGMKVKQFMLILKKRMKK